MDNVLKSQRVLAIKLHGASDGFAWAIANVYGPKVEAGRSDFLVLLTSFKSQWQVP